MFEIELFKRQNPKKYPLSKIILLILIILIILSYNIKTYDTLNVTAFTIKDKQNNLSIIIPSNKISILDNSIIEYKNKKYKIYKTRLTETIVEDNIAYEKIYLETNLKSPYKIINIKIHNNKQRIITKITNTIKEE